MSPHKKKFKNHSKSPDPPRNHTQLIKTVVLIVKTRSKISQVFLLFLNFQLIGVPVGYTVHHHYEIQNFDIENFSESAI